MLQAPVPLSAAESALLVQRPVWRLGAVRGLVRLNDVDSSGRHTGVAAEYAEQVARRLAVGLELVPFDTVAAMLDALRAGQIEIVPFLTRAPERERDFAFSAPYVSMPYMIIARGDAPLYWGLDSLRGKRLALAAQHPLIGLLAQRYPDIQVLAAKNGNEAMDAVVDGLADAAVEVKLFANLRINGDNDGRLRAVAEVTELPAQFHFAASQQARSLVPVIDRALADIPAAERERMLRRWVALDMNPGFAWRRYLPVLAVAGAALLALAAATGWWMRRLRREVLCRRKSDERLNDIGATLPGVTFRYEVGTDHQLQGTWFSPGAKAFLGIELDPTQTVLANLAPRLRPEHLAQAQRAQSDSMLLAGRFKATAAYRHPDGRELWLYAEAVAKTLPGAVTAWTGYVVDVSSERELQARVAREAEARNLLLASASHELRAPTHTLSLALQALAESGVPQAAAARLQVAQDAARTLSQLLNDVLDVARLDHGELQLRPQNFALHELVAQVAEGTRAWAERKHIGFAAAIDPDVPCTVRLDPLRLRQILTNLLSNAVKYTAQGRVDLHVGLRRPEQAEPLLVFTVSDTGRGIAKPQMERLFAPYATDESTQAPVPEGSSGLGLNICRRLAGLMGGTVTLSSESGRGTVARVELPVLGDTAASGPVPSGPGAVLVCDDDEISRMLMAHMLVSRGHVVAECGGGEEALRTLREGGIQALVTDLDMGGMGGLQLIHLLRQDEAARGVSRLRVVVCSGSPVPVRPPGDGPHPSTPG